MMEDFQEKLAFIVCAVFSDFCSYRNITPKGFQETCEAYSQWSKEHPGASKEESDTWINNYMDEKFPERT